MSRRRGFLGEISWFQLAASVLAAVTAAWIASSLGVAGTLVGAALGSAVVTLTSAFYARTLDKGRTLLVTDRQRHGDPAAGRRGRRDRRDPGPGRRGSPGQECRVRPRRDAPRLHWKTIIVTTVVVLALALAAISTYELVTGDTLDGSKGTTIGDTFGGDKGKPEPSERDDRRHRRHRPRQPRRRHRHRRPRHRLRPPRRRPRRRRRPSRPSRGMNPVTATLTRPTPWKEAS